MIEAAYAIAAEHGWPESLPVLLAAYQQAYPSVRDEDLASVVALGCAYTIASPYPLEQPLRVLSTADRGPVDSTLQRYGRERHDAALAMLDHVEAKRHS